MILAIDTSFYTTSVAAMDRDGRVLADMRTIFVLKPGERGLAPSTVVFNHVRSLPSQVEHLFRLAARGFPRSEDPASAILSPGTVKVDLVVASVRPRIVEDSYLPFFRVSEGFGRAVAAAVGAPFLELSHQEGHLAATWIARGGHNVGGNVDTGGGDGGCVCRREPPDRSFLVLQMSGGTTELLIVERWEAGRPQGVTSLGAALDVNVGQFLDHVGVRLGLSFPAGAALELEAGKASDVGAGAPVSGEDGWHPIPVSAQGYRLSFAGPEAAANRLIDAGCPAPVVARLCLEAVARGAEKVLRKAVEEFGRHDVVVCGGVAANQTLRRHLARRLGHPAVGARLVFPDPAYCTDNAVGLAEAGRRQTRNRN